MWPTLRFRRRSLLCQPMPPQTSAPSVLRGPQLPCPLGALTVRAPEDAAPLPEQPKARRSGESGADAGILATFRRRKLAQNWRRSRSRPLAALWIRNELARNKKLPGTLGNGRDKTAGKRECCGYRKGADPVEGGPISRQVDRDRRMGPSERERARDRWRRSRGPGRAGRR